MASMTGGQQMGRGSEEPNPNDGYDYMQHGFDWPGLQEGGTTKYPACSGSNQSPIDINTNQLMEPSSRSGTSAVSLNGLNVDGAQADGITLTNAKVDLEQGMKVTFDQPAANLPTIEIGGTTKSFVPIQFHFHHFLSEHTINGIHYPLELHIVMQEQDPADVATAQLAVIGIMYKYSENGDAFLNSLQTQIEGKIGDGTASYGDTGVSIDNINVKTQLLPSSLKYAGYDGSLTTPGCDERVKWHVFTTPREVTREQMKLFVDVTMGAHAGADVVNNRMIQDLGDREVYKYNY
uniref:Halotolerant alpha-type carbonic anhydrase (dCA II) n=1 Tax=Dunaliella salina TaxID=3046 RepID=UPI000050C06F|nr:Chain A, Halotolerant alpha-type carbonic anhydrase (dCA II) [Dunaliella salina]1Y7W_B Chain B, Halotolerant alpha-type carbonic anhydrase (dCA II) [Dunaliella salina]